MMNDIIKDIHENLTSGKEKIEIVYEPNVDEDSFAEDLKEEKKVDLKE